MVPPPKEERVALENEKSTQDEIRSHTGVDVSHGALLEEPVDEEEILVGDSGGEGLDNTLGFLKASLVKRKERESGLEKRKVPRGMKKNWR